MKYKVTRPYTIAWEHSGPWFRYSGAVTDADVLHSTEAMPAHAKFRHFRYYIVRTEPGVDFSGVTADAMREVAELHCRGGEIGPDVRGIAVSRTTLGTGLAAIYWHWHLASGGR